MSCIIQKDLPKAVSNSEVQSWQPLLGCQATDWFQGTAICSTNHPACCCQSSCLRDKQASSLKLGICLVPPSQQVQLCSGACLQLLVHIQGQLRLIGLDAHIHERAEGVHIAGDAPCAHLRHQLQRLSQLLVGPTLADHCRAGVRFSWKRKSSVRLALIPPCTQTMIGSFSMLVASSHPLST